MNAQVMMEVATGVVPAMAAAIVACVAVLLMRKGRPVEDARGLWLITLMLALGGVAGAVWLGGGEWKPGPSGSTWLPAMALLAGAAGLVRGEGQWAGITRRLIVAGTLMGAAWMSVRSVSDMGWPVRLAVMAAVALAGSVMWWGLEQSVREVPQRRGGWPAAAVGLIMGFGASQVLILVTAVHAAAWMAAGVSAFFGVCLAAGLLTRRAFVGRGVLAAAVVLLCGLLLHGVEFGVVGRLEAGLFASSLLVGALGPAVAARVLGDRWRGWGAVIACAAPVLGAVAVAAVLHPPPLD